MPPLDERLVYDVVQLHRDGIKWRAIARALKISRNTVRQIVNEHQEAREARHSALPPRRQIERRTKLDPFRARVEELLRAYPDITAQRVLEILRSEAGFASGYTQVRLLVRKLRPKAPPTPSLETPPRLPGEKAECDWSEYPLTFTHAPPMKLQAFGYTLRWSTRKYFGFQESNALNPLMDEHLHAFERFQGAAKKCIYDSQKPVVLRWEGNQPILNPRFVEFATYYEFGVIAVRRAPNKKPRVERSFWELVRSFFNGRSFRDLDDLKAQLVQWMDTVADLRPIKRMKRRTRMELFAEEQPLLRPLPRHPYDTARVRYMLCDISGFVAWEGNWYSLPYDYVTEILPVRITEHELFVYKADLECLARHELFPRGAQRYSILPGHRPKSAEHGPGLDQLRRAFNDLGEPANAFLLALEKREPRSASYHARKILALREGFDSADLLRALAHALDYGAVEHTAVERILAAKAERRRLDEYVAENCAKRLARVVEQSATEPRDLAEYDALPARSSIPNPPGETTCPSETSPEAPQPSSERAPHGTSSGSD